jgi:hypothetical protein
MAESREQLRLSLKDRVVPTNGAVTSHEKDNSEQGDVVFTPNMVTKEEARKIMAYVRAFCGKS